MTSSYIRTAAVLAAACVLAPSARAQVPGSSTGGSSGSATVDFPATPAGTLARALLAAINSGDTAQLRRWSDTSFSAAAHQRGNAATDAELLRIVQSQGGGLELLGVRDGEPLRWEARLRRTGRRAEMLMGVAPGAVPRAEGIGLSIVAEPAAPWPTGRLAPDAIRAAIEQRVGEAARRDDFSGVVRVMRGDRVFFEQAYGEADHNFHAPNRPDTRFNVASMGKMFVAVAIGQLVEAGKLRWDDTLAALLPEYPNADAARRITIHQLLTHSAGLGGFFDRPGYDRRKVYPTAASLLEVFAREPLLYAPGTGSRYSNEGFIVLGAVVEKVSGENFYDYVRRHVYQPAGMTDTDAFAIDDAVENVAVGYAWWDDDPLGLRPRRPNWAYLGHRGTPAGGGYSTAADMVRFSQALRGGRLLRPETVARLTAVQNGLPHYGYGFQLSAVGGRETVGHDGGGAGSGINSDLFWFRDGSWTVAVMGNYDAPAAYRVARGILGFLAGQ
ncbi:MAG TPA: serine hydrolase domain-containing protein [Longimicrobium sp.]|nr:serine hydrolase domain-containing protein [Longimicrobium sp.]